MTFLLAGHETTATSLSWTFALLSTNPSCRDVLERELGDVLGRRSPSFEDVPALRYTNAIVCESMRLYPPAWSLGREAIAEVEIGGHRIEPGAEVWIPTWSIHRDRRWFDEPLRFDPTRWLDGLAARLPRFAFFPFGGGPRQCIGNTFAMLEVTLVLATIAQRYRLTSVTGREPVPVPAATLRPRGGLEMKLAAIR
jgi:cytochrome P450